MSDFLNVVMLVGAAVGSMAFGVLAGFWIFRAGFALMHQRIEAPAAATPATETAV